ncbi:MAG: phosphoribosylanthranilate isomerase [Thermomicrobiales bacterium]
MKTCGMRTAEAVDIAIGAGADAIGFILAPSKRQVTVAEVIAIREATGVPYDVLPPFAGVTVNPTGHDIAVIAESGAFDILQLSGDEDPAILERVPGSLSVWKALRPGPEDRIDEVLRTVARWLDGPRPVERVMLDAFHPGAYGGSGVRGNWAIAEAVAMHYPIVLAGGLTPDNVETAIAEVKPFGVDAASGMETDGVKDPAKIVAFVQAAKAAGCSLAGGTA